jgi:site-specific DNA-methyltransferase (adenine-specific)
VDGEYQTRARNTEGGNSIFGLGSGGGDFVPASGRWPANFIHDGSEEVVGLFPDTSSGTGAVKRASSSDANGNQGAAYGAESRAFGTVMPCIGDAGSAARFFYCAKADTDDRLGSKHPTVKPIDLMAYLVRLVTPPKGVVLDPFAGSGATGMACMREGMRCILIEKEREYFEDILNRVSHVRGDDTPLFKEPGPCQGR